VFGSSMYFRLYLSINFISLYIHACLSVSFSTTYLSVSPSTHPSVSRFVSWSVPQYVCLSLCLFIQMFVRPSVRMCTYISVCLPAHGTLFPFLFLKKGENFAQKNCQKPYLFSCLCVCVCFHKKNALIQIHSFVRSE
jgi:hypothetical protein